MPELSHITPYSAFIHKTYTEEKKRQDQRIKESLNVRPAWNHYANVTYERVESDGEARMNALFDTLDLLDKRGFERSDTQRDLHSHFIAANLKKIYGDDLYKNLDSIMKKFGISKIRSDVIVCTPRRWGKTYATALICAALIWSQPNLTICIYSTGKRASKAMLVLIWKMIVAIAGSAEPIKVYNLQECELQVRNLWGKMGKVSSYPSKIEIDVLVSLWNYWIAGLKHTQHTTPRHTTKYVTPFLLLKSHT